LPVGLIPHLATHQSNPVRESLSRGPPAWQSNDCELIKVGNEAPQGKADR